MDLGESRRTTVTSLPSDSPHGGHGSAQSLPGLLPSKLNTPAHHYDARRTLANVSPGAPTYRKPPPRLVSYEHRESSSREASSLRSSLREGRPPSPLNTSKALQSASPLNTPSTSRPALPNSLNSSTIKCQSDLTLGESVTKDNLRTPKARNKLHKKRSRARTLSGPSTSKLAHKVARPPTPPLPSPHQKSRLIPASPESPVPKMRAASLPARSLADSRFSADGTRPSGLPRQISVQDLFTPSELFPVNNLLTTEELEHAGELEVIGEKGQKVKFRELFEHQKTIVCFIRHFWCPLCQDYMFSVTSHADPLTLAHHGVSLIIISNGSHKMIRSYRRIFKTPFALYTDPSLVLYNAMGMTLKTLDGGVEREKGDYVKHGLVGGIAMVVGHAAKARVPVWEKGGDIEQLGGEFVLGPGLTCHYAHRMNNTRAHSPITAVLTAAGIIATKRLRAARQSFSQLLAPSPSLIQQQLRSASRLAGVAIPEENETGCNTEECSIHSSIGRAQRQPPPFDGSLQVPGAKAPARDSAYSANTMDLWVIADNELPSRSSTYMAVHQEDLHEGEPEARKEEFIPATAPARPPRNPLRRQKSGRITPQAITIPNTASPQSTPPSPASSSTPATPNSSKSFSQKSTTSSSAKHAAAAHPKYRRIYTPVLESPDPIENGQGVPSDTLVIRLVDGHWTKVDEDDSQSILTIDAVSLKSWEEIRESSYTGII